MIFQLEIKQIDKDNSKKDNGGAASLLPMLFLAVVFAFALHFYFADESLIEQKAPQESIESVAVSSYQDYTYDTNVKYDKYVKGQLTINQLAQLDKMLEQEKVTGSLLDRKTMFAIAENDVVVVEAYKRWKSAKNFYRSDSKQIYPGERSL